MSKRPRVRAIHFKKNPKPIPDLDYPLPSPGTIAARKARRAVSRMTEEEQADLLRIAIEIANGKPAPSKLPKLRHKSAS